MLPDIGGKRHRADSGCLAPREGARQGQPIYERRLDSSRATSQESDMGEDAVIVSLAKEMDDGPPTRRGAGAILESGGSRDVAQLQRSNTEQEGREPDRALRESERRGP